MPYHYETDHTFPAYTPRARVRAVFGVDRPEVPVSDVIHHWGDPATFNSFDGVLSWFKQQPPTGSSSHYVLEAGRVACGVNEADAAHTNGHPGANAKTVTWECHPRCSPQDRETLAEALSDAWIGRGMDRPGLVEMHKQYQATACPGAYEKHLPEIQRRASALFAEKKAGKTSPAKVTPASASVKKKGRPAMTPHSVWAYVNAKVNGSKDAYALLTETVRGIRELLEVARRIEKKLDA